MKNLFLLLLTVFTLCSCDKDDDKAKTELDKLPPATQTGAQTFGCLIDGKAFVPPKFGSNSPNAFYQFVGGAYTLGINAATGGGTELKGINIGCLDAPLISDSNYILLEKSPPNYFGQYTIYGGGIILNGTSSANLPGNLTITRFDPVNFIISGIFEFTVLDDNGSEINITDGRFDMQYTN
jgi:hypothetical protein